MNIYCCLVCGKQFQGKGEQTQAYRHALEPSGKGSDEQHNLMIGVSGPNFGKVFCLPDDYEVDDRSLVDVKYNLDPQFNAELLARLG